MSQLTDAFLNLYNHILSPADTAALAKPLLECALALAQAHQGYIVVAQDGDYQIQHAVHFDTQERASSHYRYSRTLIREALRSKRSVYSKPSGSPQEHSQLISVHSQANHVAMAHPIQPESDVVAVIYLAKNPGAAPFNLEQSQTVERFLDLAASAIARGLRLQALETYAADHADDLLKRYHFEGIIARTPNMLDLLRNVVQIAQADTTVLITGETGTGKELIAKAIYANSNRKQKPWVTLHCGALPETLFESELFGHKRGAFTGAHSDRAGRIAQAEGGTLFIDEVAEIPLTAQAKLLRFFQYGEFQRIGSDRVEKVDVRILAATHSDLRQRVAEGSFREDLYYRLNVIELQVPPLRQRREDIPLLVDHFLKQHSAEHHLAPQILNLLESYPFPGNVRELAHTIERLCVLSRSKTIDDPKLLPEPLRQQQQSQPNHSFNFTDYNNDELKQARQQATQIAAENAERAWLEGLMQVAEGDVTRAAKHANINRTYLYRLLAKHNND